MFICGQVHLQMYRYVYMCNRTLTGAPVCLYADKYIYSCTCMFICGTVHLEMHMHVYMWASNLTGAPVYLHVGQYIYRC